MKLTLFTSALILLSTSQDAVLAADCDSAGMTGLLFEEIVSPANMCNWIANSFAGDGAKCEKNDHQVYQYSNPGIWNITAEMARDIRLSEYFEIEVSVAGPGKMLTGTFPKGFEQLQFRFLGVLNFECDFLPFLYLRRARYNRRSLDDLLPEEGPNTKIFNTDEGWTGQLKGKVEAAIRDGVEHELSQMNPSAE